jgi:hypothetical protein
MKLKYVGFEVLRSVIIFWDCGHVAWKFINVSNKSTASIFRFEGYAKEKTSKVQVVYISSFVNWSSNKCTYPSNNYAD